MNKEIRQQYELMCTAIMFYTRLPVAKNLPYSQNRLNRSRKYFPVVGILVGAIAALSFYVTTYFIGNQVAVILSIAASVLVTGAFHEDGFADSCDGLGGGWEKDSVLTIMKDSRIGTYGSVGLFMMLTLKFTCLVNLTELSSTALFLLIYICGHVVSRQLSSSAIEFFDYVQDIDLSKVKPITDNRLPYKDQAVSFAVTGATILSLCYWNMYLLLAVIIASLLALCFLLYSKKRIGGFTGDILGATQQISEVGFYVVALSILN